MPIDVKDEVPGAVATISSVRAQGTPAVDFRLPQVADWHAEGGGHIAYYELGEGPEGLAAWICVGGFWVRAEQVGTASRPVTGTPEFLDQCPTPAANLSELVGWPASDDFGGAGCNSGIVGDDNWDIRWVTTETSLPTIFREISGDKLKLGVKNVSGRYANINTVNFDTPVAGEFYATWTYDTLNIPEQANGDFYFEVIPGNWTRSYFFRRSQGGLDKDIGHQPGEIVTSAFVPGDSYDLKLTRDASNNVKFYVNDVLQSNYVNSNGLTSFAFSCYYSTAGSVLDNYMLVDNLVIGDKADGTGGQIYHDPAGTPCS